MRAKLVEDINFERNKKAKKEAEIYLKEFDKNFKNERNDENAWITSLNEKEEIGRAHV